VSSQYPARQAERSTGQRRARQPATGRGAHRDDRRTSGRPGTSRFLRYVNRARRRVCATQAGT